MSRVNALGAMLAAAALTGCISEAGEEDNAAAPAAAAMTNRSPGLNLLQPAPLLDREALLIALMRARSAAVIGADDRSIQAPLDGARFELRMRFCTAAQSAQTPGDAVTAAPPATEAPGGDVPAVAPSRSPPSRSAPAGLALNYDPEAQRVELRARPDLSLDQPSVAAIAAGQFEQVEGFWVPDPWLLAPACLVGRGGGAPAEGRVGIAQFFGPGSPRSARRDGRPYEAREALAESGPAPDTISWDLVLTGRLRHLRDDHAILCTPAPPGQPVCIIAAEFDRVTIENATTGAQLAEWSRG